MRKLLFRDSGIRIYSDENEHWLSVEWHGLQTASMVRSGCEQILRYMITARTHLILNDASAAEGIWSSVVNWMAREWFPEMRCNGMRQFAWVYAPSKRDQASADAVLARATPGSAQVFWSHESAAKWLRSQRHWQVHTKKMTDRLRLHEEPQVTS